MGVIFDVITVGAVGFASVIAFNAFWRGGKKFEPLTLVTVLALLGFAGILQVVKLDSSAPTNIAAPTPATPPPAESKEPQPFFDQLPPLPVKYDSDTEATIDGKPHPHSRGAQFCSGVTRTWEYALDGKYAMFRALLGLTGTPSPGTVVNFKVVADDRSFTKDVEIGRGVPIEVPLTGVKKLKLITTSSKEHVPCENLTAQWADAQVVPN